MVEIIGGILFFGSGFAYAAFLHTDNYEDVAPLLGFTMVVAGLICIALGAA